MSRLSPALKALISAPHALGGPLPAPSRAALSSLLDRISSRAEAGGAGRDAWLTLSTAAGVTVNSPETLCAVFDYAARGANEGTERGARSGRGEGEDGVKVAATMREVALKCISFNGIPRTINALNVLRAHWPEHVVNGLSTEPTRTPTPTNIQSISTRGLSLWDSIYAPLHTKLIDKLSSAHPDLPVHILNSHYGALLSDPFPTPPAGHAKIGRVLTSIVAITCLRSQTGVEPQVLSHVYGLKKAALPGELDGEGEGEKVQGGEWLMSDDGAAWVLESADELSELVGRGRGSFARGMERAKL